jgi:microcystin-dependent protein
MPQHFHTANATNALADTNASTSNLLAGVNNGYTGPAALVSLIPSTIPNVGGSQAHLNMQPFLTLSFCIALQGIFPSPN